MSSAGHFLAFLIAAGGCAVETTPGSGRPASAGSESARTPPPAVAALGVTEVEVRIASEAEVLEAKSEWSKYWADVGLYTLVMGVAFPFNPPAAIAGAMIGSVVFPAVAIQKHRQANWRDAIVEASKTIDFSARLEDLLEARLVVASAGVDSPRALRTVLLGFGFVGAKEEELCFSLDAEAVLTSNGGEIARDRIIMDRHTRTPDVPPPRCHSLSDLGAERGKLAREILIETTEIVAAVITKHLQEQDP